jgi:hypothetical protein
MRNETDAEIAMTLLRHYSIISLTVTRASDPTPEKANRRIATLIGVTLSLIVATASCGCTGHRVNQNTTVAESPQPTKSIAAPKVSSSINNPSNSDPIRQIDFKNFTYPWYPSFLKSPRPTRQVALHDGKFEVIEDQRADIKNLMLELEDVSYSDLTGDGKEEAIVTISGVSVFNRFVGSIFLYTVTGKQQKLLWQHEIGDRADGGLRRIAVEGRFVIVEQYQRSEGDGGLCCPKQFVRTSLRWNGLSFERIKKETLTNEYDNAEFLGYPSDKP